MGRTKSDRNPRDIFEIHAGYCAMFSNPLRLRLVFTIGADEWTVTDLAHELRASLPTVSRHLSKLRDRGVLQARRSGTNLHYRLTSVHFLEGCKRIRMGIQDVIERDGRALSEPATG